MKKTSITIDVTLDDNHVPEKLSWSATDGGIEAADAIFTPTDNTAEWTLSTTTKAASQMIEKITQTDDITTTSVITSLSVFSQ